MKRGKVRIVLGMILIVIQLLSVLGNYKTGQHITVTFANPAVFIYELIYLVSYFFVGILGMILVASGMFAYNCKKAPDAIDEIKNAGIEQANVEKIVQYCSHCGALNNRETKKCIYCGREYFEGIQAKQFMGIIAVLVLIIAAISAFCVEQYSTIVEQNVLIEELDGLNKDKRSTINELRREMELFRIENWRLENKSEFFDSFSEIVPDDGSKEYHKWGCSKLDTSEKCWIFNTESVPSKYLECQYCH